MRLRFQPNEPIVVWAQLFGPASDRKVRLLLDTGAAKTMISLDRLSQLAIPVDNQSGVLITSASDVQVMPTAILPLLRLGEHQRTDFQVLAHNIPGISNLDGLLGLDFLQGLHLSLRMRIGEMTLEEDA